MTTLTCTKCGKKLRSDNTRGICGEGGRAACRARAAAQGRADEAPPATVGLKIAPVSTPKVQGDAVSRFKVVANALGFDGDSMLEQCAQAWLDALCSRANGGPPPNLALPKQRQPAPPVRLRNGSPAVEEPGADAGAGA